MNEKNKCDADIVDIGNFCLLADKYKQYLKENGIKIRDTKDILEGCSESVSQLLLIMDDCQKALYKTGYKEENIEIMKKYESAFREGVETLTKILDSFSIVTKRIKN